VSKVVKMLVAIKDCKI